MDPYRVLLVDDEEDIRVGISRKMDWAGLGFSLVGEAENGQEALSVLEREQDTVSLILLDIVMPVMDGYEALRGVREISPDVPVIALTAYAFETDRYRMFQAGFNECLAKPLRADELRTRIAALLSR